MTSHEYYIYIIENDAGLIKIGISQNPDQRLKSLGGSNGGGHKIINTYVSPSTYLYTLENRMHTIFRSYRIEGTEWFQGVSFNSVVDMLKTILNSREYEYCNEIRKNFINDKLQRKEKSNLEPEMIL